jgi:hypothetical protein
VGALTQMMNSTFYWSVIGASGVYCVCPVYIYVHAYCLPGGALIYLLHTAVPLPCRGPYCASCGRVWVHFFNVNLPLNKNNPVSLIT